MKKILTLSAFGLLAILGFHQSAMANCYCPQGQLHGNQCVAQLTYNSQPRVLSMAVCPASPRQSKYDTPPPPVTKDICEARPQGGKACLKVYKSDPNYKFNLTETNAQGNIVYFRSYHIDGDTIKSEQWYNAQGDKHGAFKYYHQNGHIKFLGNYVNHQLQGEMKVYDEHGQLTQIAHYKDDNSVLETHYQNGKKHGQEAEFTYIATKKGLTPVVIRTTIYQNGVKHGEERFFEADKKARPKLIKTVMWQNGKAISQ